MKPLLKEAMKFSSQMKFSKSAKFPLDAMKKTIQVARECLKKMEGDLDACTMIWEKLLKYLLLCKSFHDTPLDVSIYFFIGI